jgi:hypothetical protein
MSLTGPLKRILGRADIAGLFGSVLRLLLSLADLNGVGATQVVATLRFGGFLIEVLQQAG